MAVENTTIIIGIAVLIIYLILYKKSKLLGSISMMGLAVLTFYYSSLTTDAKAYGIFGYIIFGTGLILLIDYLLQPINKRNRE